MKKTLVISLCLAFLFLIKFSISKLLVNNSNNIESLFLASVNFHSENVIESLDFIDSKQNNARIVFTENFKYKINKDNDFSITYKKINEFSNCLIELKQSDTIIFKANNSICNSVIFY